MSSTPGREESEADSQRQLISGTSKGKNKRWTGLHADPCIVRLSRWTSLVKSTISDIFCEMGESAETIWSAYNKKILSGLQAVSSSGRQPLPLHDVSLSDIRVFIKQLNRAKARRPPTVGCMRIMAELDKYLASPVDVHEPPGSVAPAVMLRAGEHPGNGPNPVTAGDIVKEWLVKSPKCESVTSAHTCDEFDLGASTSDEMVIDELAVIRANCPNEPAGITAEAISQPTLIPAYSPSQPVASLDEGPILIPGDDLGATEGKLDGITSQENAIDGGQRQLGRNPTDIVCPYCNLPKIFSVNQHIRDGPRFGLCPLMPETVSVKTELKQEATKRLSNLIVVSVPSSNKQRCGYCGLLVGTVLQDSADGTILSPQVLGRRAWWKTVVVLSGCTKSST
ncbi:hypothetical protein Pmar_PMAR009183 [Perkinsus marinus ATCC 50983]|uniref:Uncharacterized protein n=1 Tax=Perkinsus marinus (strain ATCC 50983 / TXsc) TaxID=423536 RepID=C5LE10_PERM5|nr:hypothetical protein Pmar_PMAR009183 [Perkinsus marinus ATCC 50983]EER05008.1 hypothetical protein Pmar_PMAR009183 [Perkinsus marinus ATCC 50983]|eukprot:XP_002773192.1 hypothetical protein Pmar_PMAR009183 [Perkinsus marinus ATCC 50983]